MQFNGPAQNERSEAEEDERSEAEEDERSEAEEDERSEAEEKSPMNECEQFVCKNDITDATKLKNFRLSHHPDKVNVNKKLNSEQKEGRKELFKEFMGTCDETNIEKIKSNNIVCNEIQNNNTNITKATDMPQSLKNYYSVLDSTQDETKQQPKEKVYALENGPQEVYHDALDTHPLMSPETVYHDPENNETNIEYIKDHFPTIDSQEEAKRKFLAEQQYMGGGGKKSTDKDKVDKLISQINFELHVSMYLQKVMKMLSYRYILSHGYPLNINTFMTENVMNLTVFLALNLHQENFTVFYITDAVFSGIAIQLYLHFIRIKGKKIDIDHLSGIILFPYYLALI